MRPSPLGEAHCSLAYVSCGSRYLLPCSLPGDQRAAQLLKDTGTYLMHKTFVLSCRSLCGMFCFHPSIVAISSRFPDAENS